MGNTRVGKEIIDAVKEVVSIVRHFVDHPDHVEVNIRPGPYRITAELYTHSQDVGQVVGRNGYLTTSLRAFLAAIAGKHRIKIDLDYVTEEDNARNSAKKRASTS
jgi:predicted RNA-binding protein YlqC (UPF0109 family)